MDPHPLLRLGLARILGSISSIGDVHTYDPHDLEPASTGFARLATADILLFGMCGDEALDQQRLERMSALVSPRHVLLLADDPHWMAPRHPLVAGRVRKSAPTDLIEAAVRLILAGGRCFPASCSAGEGPHPVAQAVPAAAAVPASIPHDLGEGQSWPSTQEIANGARALRITPRQFEILVLRSHGLSMKAVGQALHISEATVKAHASSMYRRLDVANCQEAIQLAVRRGVRLQATVEAVPPADDMDG
ncbi:response regulator transcription factor [Verticiella sediminum]